MGSLLLPVSLGTGRYPVAISAGGQHSCALLDNASLKCWGYNSYGQLGLGNAAHRGDGAGEMGASLPAVALGTGRTVIDVDAGGNHTCALLDNGAVKCWGNGYSGRLGHGSITHLGDVAAEMGDALLPVSLGAGRTAVDVSAGDMHSCSLLDNDTIKCWGANDYGELGLGNTDVRGTSLAQMGDNLPAVDLGPGAAPVAITSGDEHVCALLADGAVKCWGHNDYGQLGIGTDLDVGDAAGEMGASLAAVSLGTGRIAVEITAGYSHTCALLDDGSVKCWGNGAAGQIGQGDTTYRGDEPDEMGDALLPVKLGTGRTAVTVSAGGDHTCARLDDGKVKCWGSNVYGNLGLGHTQNMGNAASEVGDGLPAVDVP
jgi:alpha-tubulin suppressor-like RCC1 family protein